MKNAFAVFVHVGYPKTAGTWLQTRVFLDQPDFDYWRQVPGFDWVNEVVNLHDDDFDAKALRKRFLAQRSVNGRPQLISWGGLLGNVFAGARDTCRNADRLRAVLGEARIIVNIREQAAMIESLYQQYVAEGGDLWFVEFLDGFLSDYLNYHRVVEYYQSLFGSENVYVGLFEHLQENPGAFLSDLAEFMEIDGFNVPGPVLKRKENVSFSAVSTGLARYANWSFGNGPVQAAKRRKWLKRADKLLFGLFPAKNVMDEKTRAFVKDHYRGGNRALEANLGLPLEKYGYAT